MGWTSVLLEQHRVGDDVDYETRSTPDQRLFVLTRGRMDLHARRGGVWDKHAYSVGTAGLVPGDTTIRLRFAVEQPLEVSQLCVPARLVLDAAEHYRSAGQSAPKQPLETLGFQDETVAHGIVALGRAMASGAPDLYAETFAQWLVTHLLATHGAWHFLERSPGALTDRRLARVIEYMNTHFAEPLDLTRLAREAGVSKFHFAKLFRERVGTSPHRYLVDLRMIAARRMLDATELTIAEVAVKCGYENAAHFGAAWKRRYGLSPGAFRRRA